MKSADVIIIGAGAAGLMSAAHALDRGRSVILIEANKNPGRKIIISGGGRCNFTNLEVSSKDYLSSNEHFSKSALSQYTNWDFIGLVAERGISYHEKTLGQLFCDKSSKDILNLLLSKVSSRAEILCNTVVEEVEKKDLGYVVKTNSGDLEANSLVVASGGLSMPKMGASDIGYKIARQFGHKIKETSPALVPFTTKGLLLEKCQKLSGVSVEVKIEIAKKTFLENILFTHKGLSGPIVLKTSLYWNPKEELTVNFLPKEDITSLLTKNSSKKLENLLKTYFPNKFVEVWFESIERILNKKCAEISNADKELLVSLIHNYRFTPSGTEGYRKAEVTRGGVCTDQLSSKTLESKLSPGLFFAGEVIDVTGLLGGYNFQWAWSTGYVVGSNV